MSWPLSGPCNKNIVAIHIYRLLKLNFLYGAPVIIIIIMDTLTLEEMRLMHISSIPLELRGHCRNIFWRRSSRRSFAFSSNHIVTAGNCKSIRYFRDEASDRFYEFLRRLLQLLENEESIKRQELDKPIPLHYKTNFFTFSLILVQL